MVFPPQPQVPPFPLLSLCACCSCHPDTLPSFQAYGDPFHPPRIAVKTTSSICWWSHKGWVQCPSMTHIALAAFMTHLIPPPALKRQVRRSKKVTGPVGRNIRVSPRCAKCGQTNHSDGHSLPFPHHLLCAGLLQTVINPHNTPARGGP